MLPVMIFGGTPTWTDFGGFLAAVVAALAGVTAAVIGIRQMREARRVRIEQGRPSVAIAFEVTSSTALDLVIKNVGETTATNVRARVDEQLVRPDFHDDEDYRAVDLPATIPTLLPHDEWRTWIATTRDWIKSTKAGENPTIAHASVTFDWTLEDDHVDRFDLSIEHLKPALFGQSYGMRELVKAVEALS